MRDGGRLVWRVGDTTAAPLGKCYAGVSTTSPVGTPSSVNVTSSVWLYAWPNGSPVTPLPPLPQATMSYSCVAGSCVALPDASGESWQSDCGGSCTLPPPAPSPGPPAVVGCASGACTAFCDVAGVHGCAASWAGAADLRAPRTGGACGGALGPCAVPADACAAGWSLCLANPSSVPAGLASVRRMSAAQCADAREPRRFLAAMSHARAAWSMLPPAPCPPAPVSDDNGCLASGWGAEAVCCGGGCAVPSCPNSVWMQGTRIHIDESSGCGAVGSPPLGGILCCKDA